MSTTKLSKNVEGECNPVRTAKESTWNLPDNFVLLFWSNNTTCRIPGLPLVYWNTLSVYWVHRNFSSVQFSSVPDDIYALGKAHTRSTPPVRSFPPTPPLKQSRQNSINPFTAVLVAPSLEKRPIEVPNLKSSRLFPLFA